MTDRKISHNKAIIIFKTEYPKRKQLRSTCQEPVNNNSVILEQAIGYRTIQYLLAQRNGDGPSNWMMKLPATSVVSSAAVNRYLRNSAITSYRRFIQKFDYFIRAIERLMPHDIYSPVSLLEKVREIILYAKEALRGIEGFSKLWQKITNQVESRIRALSFNSDKIILNRFINNHFT